MTSPTNYGSATLRTIVVIALSLFVIAINVVDLNEIWHPIGVFGYGTNVDGVVTGVDPGSPADLAGMRVGDRVDQSAMSVQDRWDLVQIPAVESPGMSRTLWLYHQDVRRRVTLVSIAEQMGAANQFVVALNALGAMLFVILGAAILMLRPAAATWGFFFFCLGYAPTTEIEVNQVVQVPWVLVVDGIVNLLNSAGLAGLIVFSLQFLQASVSGWRRWALLATPLLVLCLAASHSAELVFTYVLARPAEWLAHTDVWLTAIGGAIVIIALIDTYVHRHGADRQRMRWVIFGFAVALVSQLVITIIQTEATNTSLTLTAIIELLACAAPIAVAYAVIKHHVIDINFVMSRTLVYGALTTLFVGVFAFIDWFVGRVLDQTRWALVAEIAVAIAVGFWLNGLHARVDQFVDSVLFRRRHAAERRLARLTRGLPHSTSTGMIDTSLISEPYDALELTSAALFRRDASGRYERVSSHGWPASCAGELGTDDPLILHLQAERGAIRLSEIHWARDDAPGGAARPALALPIVVRHELDAIALFGGHRGGEDFDPDEIAWLNALSVAAGAAYDHLEADALRQELQRVRTENETQRLALQQHGLLPA